jgi:TonB-linked SusC/RagA family outer membrane protein
MKNLLFVILLSALLQIPVMNYAQSINLNGVVLSASDNSPLIGASIVIKGTTQGTVTDADGKFSLTASQGQELVFSYVGFETKTVTIQTSNYLQVELKEGSNQLDEVVVTALGITKENKSLGYSVKELKSAEFSEAKESNLVNSLAGKVAGVRITNSQGNMGSSRIIIRGENSIAGNNQPLFVVDGVPVDNSQLGSSGTSGASGTATRDYANAISDINSEDIESISILKGPNAAALYGSRAANGVILLKTKNGKGKKGLGVNLYYGTTWESILTLPSYQNVYGQGTAGLFEYVDGKGGGVNDGVDESWGPKMDGRLIKQFNSNGVAVPFIAHPDNVRDFFETGYTATRGLSVSSSGDKYNYRFSFNNSYQKGISPNTNTGKNSFGLNTSYKIAPDLELSASGNYVRSNSDNLPGSFGRRATSTMLQFTWFGRQVDINALKKYRDEDGNPINWNNSYYSNPYFIAHENTVSQRRDRIFGNVNLKYTFLKHFTANYRVGNDYYNDRRKLKIAYGTNGTPYGSYQEVGYTINENNQEFTLNYQNNLGSDFSVDILAGGNALRKFYEENSQKAPRLAVAGVYTLNNSRDALESTNYYSKQEKNSVFSSAQIGFRNYAFLNLTARNDWSSTLPSANNSYFYPSINASVVLSQALGIESKTLTFLKVRGGWSKVGNDADPYQLINTYQFSTPFNSNPLLSLTDKSLNKNLKPETTTSAEAGVEAGFFDNRIRADISVYNTNSYDQILSEDVSPSTGFNSKLLNAGEINNKGIDAQLSLVPVKLQNGFTWEVTLNYAKNKSEVVSLDKEGLLSAYTVGTSYVQVLAAIGQPYGTLFGTAYERNDKGEIIVNADGTPAINSAKQTLGSFQPDWTGSIHNSFTYKGVDLSFLIDARFGGSLYSGTYSTGIYTGVLEETLQGRDAEHGGLAYYNASAPVAVDASHPAPAGETVYYDGILFNGVNADGSKNTQIVPAESFYKALSDVDEASVFDATFIKLREVKLGYTLPARWTQKVKLGSATISLVGRNLWIIHKDAPHIDSETEYNTSNLQGVESLQLPTTRSYGFNISVNF